jgi:hypothetical protein
MSEMLDFSVDQTIDNSTNFWKNSPIPTGFEPEIQEILLGKRKRKLYEFEANSIKSHKSQSYPESLHLSEIRKSCGGDLQI